MGTEKALTDLLEDIHWDMLKSLPAFEREWFKPGARP